MLNQRWQVKVYQGRHVVRSVMCEDDAGRDKALTACAEDGHRALVIDLQSRESYRVEPYKKEVFYEQHTSRSALGRD